MVLTKMKLYYIWIVIYEASGRVGGRVGGVGGGGGG